MLRPRRYENWLPSCWPELDRRALLAASSEGDGFTSPGPATRLAPRTRANAEQAYGRYLDYLSRTGQLTSVDRVGDRLQLKPLRGFGEELQQCLAPMTILCIFCNLSRGVRVMDPTADRTTIKKVISRLANSARPIRDIESRMLTPIEARAVGEQMMDEADLLEGQSTRSAVLHRNGLLIAGGALYALRRENWRIIVVGKHLKLLGATGHLEFDEQDMKGRRRFGFELGSEYVARLNRHIEHFRPRLLSGRTDPGFLFLSRNGTQMFGGTISMSVKEALIKRTGKDFTHHMFRHSAASFVAEHAPEQVIMSKYLLHHRRLRTTTTYIRSKQRRAFVKYQEAVQDIVRRGKRRS